MAALGVSTRFSPVWSEFHIWVEFVVGSRACSESFFSGYPGILFSSKTRYVSFIITWWMHACAFIK